MRFVVILLVLVAIAKVATIEGLRRSASDELIISTFAPKALEACSRDGRRRAVVIDAAEWQQATAFSVEVGRRSGSAQLWQIDDPNWAQKYRHAFLHVSAGAPAARISCQYDVIAGTALATKP